MYALMTVSRPLLSFISLCSMLLFSVSLSAQQPGSSFPNSRGSGNQSDGSQREILPDTFGVFAFQVDNPNEERSYIDSSLTHFHQYDPTRLQLNDYAHLGLPGSAHYALVYEPRLRSGLDLGWHQYDLYYNFGRSASFYRLERPFTELRFVEAGAQRDNNIGAKFSRNFAQGLNFMIDYHAITQEAEANQYPDQSNQTRALVTGMWYHSANGRYDGFLSYAANTTNSQDNAGVIRLGERGEYNSPSTADVFLQGAQTRYALREVMYTQYYRFGGQRDSSGRSSRAFTISHQLDYDRNTYRFADDYQESLDSFFISFPDFLVDTRGVRYFVDHTSVSNSFRLSTFKLAAASTTSERKQKDLLQLGITHQLHQLDFEPTQNTINNLLLNGSLGLRPGNRLRLQVEAELALLDQAGDFRLNGLLDIDLQKAGTFSVELINQLYTPSFLQRRFYLSQQEVWNNNFNKTLETNLKATYALPKYGLKLTGHYHLLNDYIYFDTVGTPQQLGSAFSIFQLAAEKNFRFGHFTLANRLVWQEGTSDVIPLPSIFGKHSLYYNGKWFRALDVQLGFDCRYTTDFQAYYYNPIIGQFQLQDDRSTTFFPNVDFHFNMRVKAFRAFFKLENMTSWIEEDERLILTSFYPYPGPGARFGINWRLLD